MSRVDDIIKSHPDDIPAQIDALSEAALTNDYSGNNALAMELHQKAYDLVQEAAPDKLPEILPKYMVTYYLKNYNNEKAVQEFKKNFKKNENGEEIWNRSMKFYLPLFETTFKKLQYSLRPNFFIQTNFFPELADHMKTDVDYSLDSLLQIINIVNNCKSGLKSSVLHELSQACFMKISKFEHYTSSELRTIDEKKLKDVLTFIKDHLKTGEGKAVEKYEISLAFEFILSSYLSKQFDGLLRLNSYKSFSKELIDQIKDRKIIPHLLSNMHQDLAGQFSMMLSKYFNQGNYDKAILRQYWTLSLSQHSSVLGKFFDPWPTIVKSIPKSNMNDFWDLVKETKSFPEPVIKLLQKVSPNAGDDVKKAIFGVLWNSMEGNKMDFVAVLTDYTTKSKEDRNEIIEKCCNLIEQKDDIIFALNLMSHLWISISPEITKTKFDLLLAKCKPDPSDIELLFSLLVKMAENVRIPLEKNEIKMLKLLVKPYITVNKLAISNLFSSLLNAQKGKLFDANQLTHILKWITNDVENVDYSLFNLSITIFAKINNITNDNSPIPSMNLTGIDTMWDLLFKSKLQQVSNYFVNLVIRCTDQTSIGTFISKCLTQLDSMGALFALRVLVLRIEEPMDRDQIGIHKNLYVPKYALINVICDGDFKGTLSIFPTTKTSYIKTMISRRTNINESQITLLQDQTALEESHVYQNDENITVCIASWTLTNNSAKIWKKEELPSQILKQPQYFNKLLDLLTNENQQISEQALYLLNSIETNENELNKFKTDNVHYETELNPQTQFLMLYKLNLLANLISSNDKAIIANFYLNGGFKQLVYIIFNIEKEYPVVFYVLELILKAVNQSSQLKTEKSRIYQEIGVDTTIQMTMNKISSLLSATTYDTHPLLVLLAFLLDLTEGHQDVLLLQDDFPSFYEKLLFNKDYNVRSGILRILCKIPTEKLETITFDHLQKASEGNCNEYIFILKNIAKNSNKPKELFSLIFNSLKTNLFQYKSNTLLEFENEEEDQNELQQVINDLCAKEANEIFVIGTFEIFDLLLSRIEIDIKDRRELVFFIIEKVVFNTNRYVPVPFSSFSLLTKLIGEDQDMKIEIIKKLKKIHDDCPSSSSYPQGLSNDATIRGLQNMGCTCYLNSSMQQIFRIENVRNAVLSYQPDKGTDLDNDWAAQLCLVFSKLLYAPLKSLNMSSFVKNWLGWDGCPINPMEQQDAVEFIQMILDRIDEKFNDTKPVTQSVRGTILHQMKGITVDYQSDSHETFTTFGLEVQGKSNLKESYEAVLIPDTFTHYKASEELGYIDANSYTSIEKAPEVLIFQLKRFDYDLQTMSRKKINSKYEFSLETDISIILTENQNVENPTECLYELCGVVMHSGSAMGGHYFSYCKNEITNDWCICNDSTVTALQTENVITNSIGGLIEVNVFDQKTKAWTRQKKENLESAYLLFYKKKDRPKQSEDQKEPICLLKPTMLRYFLKDQKSLILRNILLSNDYLAFVNDLTSSIEDELVYEFLFDNLVHNFIDANFQLSTESFGKFVTLKLAQSPQFCSYFLSHDDILIEFLKSSNNMTNRNDFVQIVNESIKHNPTEGLKFINKIIEQLPEIIEKWMNFDQIFQPIYYYVTRIDSSCPNWLKGLVDFLNKTVPNFFTKPQDLENFESKVNLSYVFKTIHFLISKLNAIDEYQSIVIDQTFMNRWFKSPSHTFDFASLVAYFIRDNQERTDDYLSYIKSNSSRMACATLAAHFANCCSFSDSLTEYRVKWFFNDDSPSKQFQGYELSQFINEAARNIQSIGNKSSSLTLIKLNQLWLENWLLSIDSSVRRSCKSFITSLFPTFKRFPTSTSFLGYPTLPTTPVDSLTPAPEETESIRLLFHRLLSLSKSLITACKTGQNMKIDNKPIYSEMNIPASDYLEILSYCTFYGQLQSEISKNRGLFANLADFFSDMKPELRQSSKDLVHFVSQLQIPDFFDNKTLNDFLKMASKIPKDKPSQYAFVESMSSMLFPIITPSPSNKILSKFNTDTIELISKAKITKYAIRTCMGDMCSASKAVIDLIESTSGLVNSNETVDYSTPCKQYSNFLLETDVFEFHINNRSIGFLKLLGKLFESNEIFVSAFKNSKSLSRLQAVIIKDINHLSIVIADELMKIFSLLSSFTKGFVARDYKGNVFVDPNKQFVQFWKSKDMSYLKLINSMAEQTANFFYDDALLKFLSELFKGFTSDFSEIATSLLLDKQKDLYLKMNKSIRKKFALFTFDTIDILSQLTKKNKISNHTVNSILFEDLKNLQEFDVYDPSVWSIYLSRMKQIPGIDQNKLVNFTKVYTTHCDDITMFGDCDAVLSICNSEIKDENEKKVIIDGLADKCAKLIKTNLDSLTIEQNKSQQKWVLDAVDFLDSIKAHEKMEQIGVDENKLNGYRKTNVEQ